MRKIHIKRSICIILFSLLLCCPFIISAQENTSINNEKLKKAEKMADLFINRFEKSLNLTVFWNEFRSKKLDCALVKLDIITSVSDKEKVKISRARLEKGYLALMNYYLLSNAYELTVNHPDSKKTEEQIKPQEIIKAENTSEYVKTNGKEPKTAKEVEEFTLQFNKVSGLYRKYMPRNVMQSAAWKANYNRLLSFRNDGSTQRKGNADFCISENSKYYTVDRGLFYFYIVEETGKMKVVGLGIGN